MSLLRGLQKAAAAMPRRARHNRRGVIAGVLGRGLFVDAEADQKRREQRVAFIDLRGDLHAGIRQRDEAVAIDQNILPALQNADRTADARLGKPHMLRNVQRAHRPLLAQQHEDRLQIHFTGFLQMHGKRPLFQNYIKISYHFPAKKASISFRPCCCLRSLRQLSLLFNGFRPTFLYRFTDFRFLLAFCSIL